MPAGPEEGAQFGRFDNFFLVTDGVQDNKHPNDGGHRWGAAMVSLRGGTGGGRGL